MQYRPYKSHQIDKLPEEWKKMINVPIYKKGDKTDCSNYRGISLLPNTYKTLSNILLSRLTPYAEKITGDQCGFRHNRSTVDHILCICQIFEKKKKGTQLSSASAIYRLQESL
jgi:hypothetical protein